ncbi:hypothetical protein [Edwardsiella tarda]|uniref:hypothetical protein n=1 Tax=Edwardsiella tarda TaxID=636 RepID=UPI00351C5A52
MLHCFEVNITNKYNHLWSADKLIYSIGDLEGQLTELITECVKKDGTAAKIYEHKDLLDNWFPKSGCHLFISHSHADKKIAISIANELYIKFGIKSFIDSEFWGFVDKAIYGINDKHSRIAGRDDVFEYNKCMRVASNFHLMLANALTDGIYYSDSCLFIKTDNSMPLQGDDSGVNEGTLSPWIFTEINYTSTVAIAPHPKRPRHLLKAAVIVEGTEGRTMDSALQIAYRPKTEHMTKVDEDKLIQTIFSATGRSKENDLDIFANLDKIYTNLLR